MESDEAKKQKQSSLNHSFAIAMFNFIGERKKKGLCISYYGNLEKDRLKLMNKLIHIFLMYYFELHSSEKLKLLFNFIEIKSYRHSLMTAAVSKR